MAPSRHTVDCLLPLRPVVFQVLLSLLDAEMHGYALVQDIARRTAAGIELEPGNLYRHLKFMLDAGLIEESERRPVEGRDDERRRYYRITKLGRSAASEETRRLEGVLADARARLARSQGTR
ncbi:MAG: PadR family transcriptional regulator [Vicinamibacterales bacterium]